MKILILGASNCQVNAILRAKQKGHTVIVSDYYEDSPGKKNCDYKEIISTFDVPGNIEIAKKYGIDAVMTIGTDQPVYTAARVAEDRGLPAFIDVSTAKAVTNKKVMKNIFKTKGISTVDYRIIKEDFCDDELIGVKFPVVVKPLDSQGQRGIYRLENIGDIRKYFKDILSYSREKEILVEEYYDNDEITISGWVVNGETYIITITDRIVYNNYPHIGICTAHDFPSKYLKSHFQDFNSITRKIVHDFNIQNGPIYFQMLIGKDGIKVNEIACRIGGAYEDEFIPMISGIDILGMAIDFSLGMNVDYTSLENYDLSKNNNNLSVQMIFARPGIIKFQSDMDEIKKLPGVVQGMYNFKYNYKMEEIINATQRAGYFIVNGESRESLKKNIKHVYEKLNIKDEYGTNLVIKF